MTMKFDFKRGMRSLVVIATGLLMLTAHGKDSEQKPDKPAKSEAA